jgi:uncharacterized protein (DUF2252 family)
VKRLAASVAVAGRGNGFEASQRTAIIRYMVGEYRSYCTAQASGNQVKRFDKTVAKGQREDSARAFERLAVKGRRTFGLTRR